VAEFGDFWGEIVEKLLDVQLCASVPAVDQNLKI